MIKVLTIIFGAIVVTFWTSMLFLGILMIIDTVWIGVFGK